MLNSGNLAICCSSPDGKDLSLKVKTDDHLLPDNGYSHGQVARADGQRENPR
jgi:hypothetical protein